MAGETGVHEFDPWEGDPRVDRFDREAFAAWLAEYGHDLGGVPHE